MRRVKLTCAMKTEQPFMITGDKDAVVRLADSAAQWVVIQGNGVYVDEEPQPGPTRAELERQEAEAAAGTLKKIDEDEHDRQELVADGVEPPADDEPKKPYGNAPKSAWVRYAVSVDENLTQERAEGMTKADLMSRYGDRL